MKKSRDEEEIVYAFGSGSYVDDDHADVCRFQSSKRR